MKFKNTKPIDNYGPRYSDGCIPYSSLSPPRSCHHVPATMICKHQWPILSLAPTPSPNRHRALSSAHPPTHSPSIPPQLPHWTARASQAAWTHWMPSKVGARLKGSRPLLSPNYLRLPARCACTPTAMSPDTAPSLAPSSPPNSQLPSHHCLSQSPDSAD